MSSRAGLLALLALFAAAPAFAREVDWTAELATDAAFATGTLLVNRFGPDRARYVGDDFSTQSFDDRAHRALHGDPTAPETTEKERRYRELSNVTVVLAAGLPAGLALATSGDQAAGRVLTTAHALLAGGFLNTALKRAVARPRPKARQDEDVRASGDEATSFPSGHAQAAFTGATLVGCLFPDAPAWLRATGYGLAAATALFRIAGDKHFFTDVAAGGLLGVGVAHAADAVYSQKDGGLSLRPGWRSFAVVYDY